jgi:hypothetical protein
VGLPEPRYGVEDMKDMMTMKKTMTNKVFSSKCENGKNMVNKPILNALMEICKLLE